MTKIFLKISLLITIPIFLIQGGWACIPRVSPLWGDEIGNLKYEHYQSHAEDLNTLFIGSSRFYRHIVPSEFDARVKGSRSFNFGAMAFYGHKSLLLLNDLIAQKKSSGKIIFFEFDFGDTVDGKNLHHPRTYYPYEAGIFLSLVRSVLEREDEVKTKFIFLKRHMVSFVDNFFKVGCGYDFCKALIAGEGIGEKAEASFLGEKGDGYLSLDAQYLALKGDPAWDRRAGQIQEFPEILDNLVSDSRIGFAAGESMLHRQAYMGRIFKELLVKAEARKIKLIFVLSPRRHGEYKQLLPVFNTLPVKNRLELADPEKYPEFYSKKNSFDVGHMNHQGALLFTECLSQKFMALEALASHE